MSVDITRSAIGRGTRIATQAAAQGRAPLVRAILFDGRPMIDDGVPPALDHAMRDGVLPPLTAVYVESIEGAAKRGPTRCASLTTASTLGRLASDLEVFLADDPLPLILVGHSLGAIAALHVSSTHLMTVDAVVSLSAALWWPGEEEQLSGAAVIDAFLAAPATPLWMTAGDQEGRELLAANADLSDRLGAAGRAHVRQRHDGGHDVRTQDVVAGLSSVIAASSMVNSSMPTHGDGGMDAVPYPLGVPGRPSRAAD